MILKTMSKQVKVRIAVCVDSTGDWCSGGWRTTNEDDLIDTVREGVDNYGHRLYWVEANLDIPEYGETVQGTVSPIVIRSSTDD